MKTLNDFGNSEHRCAFLSEIDQKLTDHVFHSSYQTYDIDWEVTKNNLLHHYNYLQKSSDVMVATVENLHQAKDEDLVKYAERARTLLNDLNLAYKPLTSQLRNENDKKVARYFVRGLNNMEVQRLIPLGIISNLDDTIAQVLNLEAATGTNVPARDLFCQTCRSVGHRESSCRLRNRDTNEVLTSLLLSLSTRQNNNSANRNAQYTNNRPRPMNYFPNNNNGQTQNRGNFVNTSQMNNNLAQNRGNTNNY